MGKKNKRRLQIQGGSLRAVKQARIDAFNDDHMVYTPRKLTAAQEKLVAYVMEHTGMGRHEVIAHLVDMGKLDTQPADER